MRVHAPIQTAASTKAAKPQASRNFFRPFPWQTTKSSGEMVSAGAVVAGHSLSRLTVHPPELSENRSPASGQKLPQAVRGKMEKAFEQDFSSVRIHEDKSADSLGALAYTQGEHIYFRTGKRQLDNHRGQQLLGHELAHVVQQRLGRVAVPQGTKLPINSDSSLETEAENLGRRAASGMSAGTGERSSGVQHGSVASSVAPIQCNGDEERRKQLAEITGPMQSPYPKAVNGVNRWLWGLGVPLPKKAFENIKDTVIKAESGEISQPTAHLAEVGTFARELVKGPEKKWAALGVAANLAGFLASGAMEQQQYIRGKK